jgi:hypothetical protein
MASLRCLSCGKRFEVSDSLTGKVVRCICCGEIGRAWKATDTGPPKREVVPPPPPAPPPPAPVAPATEQTAEPQQPPAGDTAQQTPATQPVWQGAPRRIEPWYFTVVEVYANLTSALGIVVGGVLLLVLAATRRDALPGGNEFLFGLGALAAPLAGIVHGALLLLFLDIARSLRRLRS